MIGNLFKIIILVSIFSSAVCAQFIDFPKPPDAIYGTEDRCFGSVLPKQEFHFALGKVNTFKKELTADNGRVFELSLESGISDFGDLPVWRFELTDRTSPKELAINFLESYAFGYAGMICPELKPRVIDGNNKPLWCEGRGYPFIKTVRNIRVDDFVVTLAATDIKWKDSDQTKASEVDVTVGIGPWRDRTDKDKFPPQRCTPKPWPQ
ncbi:MAG: hypothetical protein K1X52_07215 [Pyrinomonadaceae bacterium]|nr:hypothetical protein [Pyrinomonadaceae bacterium]